MCPLVTRKGGLAWTCLKNEAGNICSPSPYALFQVKAYGRQTETSRFSFAGSWFAASSCAHSKGPLLKIDGCSVSRSPELSRLRESGSSRASHSLAMTGDAEIFQRNLWGSGLEALWPRGWCGGSGRVNWETLRFLRRFGAPKIEAGLDWKKRLPRVRTESGRSRWDSGYDPVATALGSDTSASRTDNNSSGSKTQWGRCSQRFVVSSEHIAEHPCFLSLWMLSENEGCLKTRLDFFKEFAKSGC